MILGEAHIKTFENGRIEATYNPPDADTVMVSREFIDEWVRQNNSEVSTFSLHTIHPEEEG